MSKPFYFNFYVKDWLSDPDVRCLTNAQRGIYIELLCHYYLSDGKIPQDQMMKLSGAKRKEDLQKVAELGHFKNKFWVCSRAEVELKKIREKSKKASNSAKNRWKEEKGDMRTHTERNANAMLNNKQETINNTTSSEILDYFKKIQHTLDRFNGESFKGLEEALVKEFSGLLERRKLEGNPIDDWKKYLVGWVRGQNLEAFKVKAGIKADHTARENFFKPYEFKGSN